MATEQYTLEQAEEEIAKVHGEDDVLREAFSQDDVSDEPNAPASGTTMFTDAGHLKYTNNAATAAYWMGRRTLVADSALTLSTTLTTVGGMSFTVAPGGWLFQSHLLINPNANTGAISYQVNGTATVGNGRFSAVELFTSASAGPGVADYNTFGNSVVGTAIGGSGGTRITYITGYFVVTVTGTIRIQVRQAATVGGSVVQYGTFSSIFPAATS